MKQIIINGVTYNIIKIYPFTLMGHFRKSLWLKRPESRGVIYNVIQYGDGGFSPIASFKGGEN